MIAIFIDLVDGYVARVRHQTTSLGDVLDNEFDALGLLIAISLAVWYRTLPVWFLPIGMARYAFSFGIWLRHRKGLQVYPLPQSTSRRPIAGFTMGFTSAMLWPIVSPPGSVLAGLLFLVPFGASFTRDWLVVSGALDPNSTRYQKRRSALRSILLQWFPLILRIAFVLAVGILILNWKCASDDAVTARNLADLTILLVGAIMIALGFAGRFAALVIIFPLGFAIIDSGPRPLLVLSLLTNLSILLLGTGAGSLWKPEIKLFGRRWGMR
jgi:CDP-diacylglycerol--glycerol-3-phosphate 3-phosphatidyltransferase